MLGSANTLAMQRPRLPAGGQRHRQMGAGCKEMLIPVQPLMNHIPLREHLGIKTKVAGLKSTPASQEKMAAAERRSAAPVAKPSFLALPPPEQSEVCARCWLPLGGRAYHVEQVGALHGECRAQLILQDMQKDNEARLRKDAAVKRELRAKYDIGWKIERLPTNGPHAARLGFGHLPHGLCALVWSHQTGAVGLVPTTNPAAAINLEYLSLALRCRKVEGREPLFSLDPKLSNCTNKMNLWQVKRFEPAWLNGTSLGEAMFQADYHLKELSMGESAQPVSGMRSALEISEEEGLAKEWLAREWFIVNKAEIQVSKDSIISARIEMGVEARETVKGAKGLEDVPVTRPDHPLVQYADAFTRYFDLIAERRSSIFHLRELAKASAVAKFLCENNARLGEEWFNLADLSAGPSPHYEVPQIWNEQRVPQIQVEDGRIEGSRGLGVMHGVYGGVQAGVDELARVAGVPVGRVPTAKVTMARAPALSQRLIQARTGLAEMPLEVPGAPPGVPKGVDLNLDKFNLEALEEAEGAEPAWSGEEFVGRAFWKSLSSSATLKEEDRSMLKELYNPLMCDRREDREFFMPPDASLAYVAKLRALLKEEAVTRQRRKEHFLSAEFDSNRVSALLPGWRPSGAVQHGQEYERELCARPDCERAAAQMLKAAGTNAVPACSRTLEDGTCFRVYHLGGLEIRTVQEPGCGGEAVGAAFTSRLAGDGESEAQNWSSVAKTDRLVKASLYVEPRPQASPGYFLLLETNQDDAVVVDVQVDGTMALAEKPRGLEARKAQAKALRAVECAETRLTVEGLRQRLQQGGCLDMQELLTSLIPAREKVWALLEPAELSMARELSILSAEDWDDRSADIFHQEWDSLSASQRAAAESLSFTPATWRPFGQQKQSQHQCQSPPAPASTWEMRWEDLTTAQQEAAAIFGLGGQAEWEAKPAWQVVRRTAGVGAFTWEKCWAQLSQGEQHAAAELGMGSGNVWDEAAWEPKAAWQRTWAELKQDEQEAAKKLSVHSAAAWDAAFGGEGKKGQGLDGVWEKSWSELEQDERMAAKVLGICGSGAWDANQGKSSPQKMLARLSQAEQEALVAAWVEQTYGRMARA